MIGRLFASPCLGCVISQDNPSSLDQGLPRASPRSSVFFVYLETRASRCCFGALLLLITGSFSASALRVWIADHAAASTDPERWRFAARLESGNAAYWAKLGSLEHWNLDRSDLRQAAKDYEKAVATNAFFDGYWMELGGIYESLGKITEARAAYEQAKTNHPISPQVAWRYGNFLIRQSAVPEACAEFRRALLVDPDLTEGAVAECWKTPACTAATITQLIPADNRYLFKAIDYFGRQSQFDEALRLWIALVALHQPFELHNAVPIINDLLFAGRVKEAQQVWQQALAISGWPRDTSNDAAVEPSVVFNGSFEHPLLNGAFDWRSEDTPHAAFAFDPAVAHSGTQSLRVSFDGKSNINFQHLLQYVPVEPSRRYRFTVYLKSSNLSTDSGVRFMFADPLHPTQPQIYTEALTGTHLWTRVDAEFITQSDTRLLSIVLRRTPSAKFDNKLNGIVWVDDVSLTPLTNNLQDLRP